MQYALTNLIVIMTRRDPAKLKERCLSAGAVAYLQKPIELTELIAVVRNALEETMPQE